MRLEFNYDNLTTEEKNRLHYIFVDNILKRGYLDVEEDDNIDNVQELLDFDNKELIIPIWIEVPIIHLNNDIPSLLSFSSYQDISGITIQRKWSDFSVLRTSNDTNYQILYIDSITSNIAKEDLRLLRGSSYRIMNNKRLSIILNDENDVYYSDVNIV